MKKQRPIEDYPVIGMMSLLAMSSGVCPCCNKQFSKQNRPDLTGKCHTGPVFVSVWLDWLCFECGTCHKVIGRVRVHDERWDIHDESR